MLTNTRILILQTSTTQNTPPNVNVQVNLDIVLLLTLLSTIVSTLIGVSNRQRLNKSPLRNIQARIKPQDIERDREIEQVLARMLGTANCSRVIIALFTNGTEAYIFPFRYFSIFWEVLDEGMSPLKFKYQKVQLDRIRAELQLCMENPSQFNIAKLDSVPIGCRQYLLNNNIHTVFSRLIGNERRGFSAIVNLQFASDPGDLPPSTIANLNDLFLVLESKIERKSI